MQLDTRTKTLLTVLKQPLNPSADIDAMGECVEALWSGSVTPRDLEALVERTSCIEQIENFADHVPGADAQHLREIVAVIEVTDA